jgi:alkylated DNA repair dioxygenase AlkB
VPWLQGPPGCNGTSASLRITWHQSLGQRHLRWASDPYRGSSTSSTSPSPRSTMPKDDYPRRSTA